MQATGTASQRVAHQALADQYQPAGKDERRGQARHWQLGYQRLQDNGQNHRQQRQPGLFAGLAEGQGGECSVETVEAGIGSIGFAAE
ncbi:hypothetical protein D3C76_1714470 [compost metagenome]